MPMLVTTEQLAAHLDDSAWIVFDCRHDLMDAAKGERAYAKGHIPGARFASVDTVLSGAKTGRNGRHPLPNPAAFAGFLAAHGVGMATQVVAYDASGGQYAARFWWLARWIGVDHVVLLDGGWAKWVAENRPQSAGSAAVPEVAAGIRRDRPADRTLNASPNPAHVWAAEDVLGRMNDPHSALIDARAPERYRGEVEPVDAVAGHIPGALNRFFKANLHDDLTFRSPDALRQEFEALLAGKRASEVGHQCGSGITACVNLFAMEYAGLRGSKLYAGSWSEWIADPKRPVARG